jgi:ABC-type Na+ transport system ATPase subunit NatA
VENGTVAQNGNVIVIRDLTKQFDDITAVNGLNLEIRKGEMFGFLGPNGAGKTTTISMLCGLVEPTAGSTQIGGFDIGKEPQKVKKLIGVCPQEVAVFKFLTGMENLELFGKLHGMDKQVLKERATDLVNEADFSEAARRKTKGYSGGMKRQLNLMIALISDPEIVFLDEPTVGMDARARRRTWEYIGSLKEQGKTVIGLSVIFIVPMMMFGALLAVFNETTRTIARFTPNYYVSDSLSIIFHQGSISDPAIWQNLLILAIISLVAVVAGIQLFKRIGYR